MRLLISVLLLAATSWPLSVSHQNIVPRFIHPSSATPGHSQHSDFTSPLEKDPQGSNCVYKDKRVLQYLRDMIRLCRRFHRPDLADEYQDAWEFAATVIYGPLPARKPPSGHYVQPEPKPVNTLWRRQMLAKPYRKIALRFTEVIDGTTIEYEQLVCGHRVMAGIEISGEPPARRRRCSECAREAEAKKKPTSASIANDKAVQA